LDATSGCRQEIFHVKAALKAAEHFGSAHCPKGIFYIKAKNFS